MVAYQVEELKAFTQKLFLGGEFDDFLVKEVNIVTFNHITIDGRIRHGFYTEEERQALGLGEFSSWKLLRPVCFSLIKGRRLPESFRIDFQAGPERVEAFLKERQILSVSKEQITGLYLHIRYEEGKLSCVTGMSLSFFTLDKGIEKEWDQYAGMVLRGMGILWENI